MSHQAWLEAPYQEAAAREDLFEEFMEDEGYTPLTPDLEAKFEKWLDWKREL